MGKGHKAVDKFGYRKKKKQHNGAGRKVCRNDANGKRKKPRILVGTAILLVREVKVDGQLEIQLDSGALVRATQRIADGDVNLLDSYVQKVSLELTAATVLHVSPYLWSVERTIAGVQGPLDARVFQAGLQLLHGAKVAKSAEYRGGGYFFEAGSLQAGKKHRIPPASMIAHSTRIHNIHTHMHTPPQPRSTG